MKDLAEDPPSWTRRDVLRSLVAATGLPALHADASPRRRVGIIGAGMAGVSLAWLLDGERDVVLLEARESIGGNIRSLEVGLDGHTFVVDMGAQYFHPGPYPAYTTLLRYLGLYPASDSGTSASHAFAASITVRANGEPAARFVSPVLPGRAWPLIAPWNLAGVAAFAVAFAAAKRREDRNESWDLSVGDWLPTLGLSRQQWEGMLLPWVASLFSGDIDHARSFSARAAMVFAAKALPANPLDPVLYYVLAPGLAEVLRLLMAQCSTVDVLTAAVARQIVRTRESGFEITCEDGRRFTVDDLVLASSGPGSLRLLDSIPGTGAQRAALTGIEFRDARLVLHTDPVYAEGHPSTRSFLNCAIDGPYCEASMWLENVIAGVPRTTTAKLWKSWITHRIPPDEILHDVEFSHLVPTTATMAAQRTLGRLQGRAGIWFAGGYTLPFDSQETALWSAIGVAFGLRAVSFRCRALLDTDR